MGRGRSRGGRKSTDAAEAGTRGTAAEAGTAGAGRSGTAAAAAGAGRGRSSGTKETERGMARQTTTAAAQAGTGTRKDTAAAAAAGTGIGTAGSAAGGRRCCRCPSPPRRRLAPLVALNALSLCVVWFEPEIDELGRDAEAGDGRVVGGDHDHGHDGRLRAGTN